MTSDQPPTCAVLDRLNGSEMKFEECGQPADRGSLRLQGRWMCSDHLEEALSEEMSS